ncbi:MAG: hypothetical protein RBR20_15025 [Desulfobacterales bacterium]|jgi:hypothetical protein|nr:hypothetical protein [Desulfobacteraceae bacterium]MDD3992466.1 hypothetical protein [Desulfobacteraceae bacterium]MDY0313425.1 hypothetical protein [Desulfobacterales bacterium]
MNIRNKTLLSLILLCVVDVVIPLPITGLILVYVVVQRPPWFVDLADRIYRS